jgi:hypothetical protein
MKKVENSICFIDLSMKSEFFFTEKLNFQQLQCFKKFSKNMKKIL